MSKKIIKVNQSIILYDDTSIHHMNDDIFEPIYWTNSQTMSVNKKGRSSVFFIKIEGKTCALKHYYRGGLLSRLIYDQYFWIGLEKTRSFLEWNILLEMRSLHLPVPIPIAARVKKSGLFYQADLLTEVIPNIESMGDKLRQELMTDKLWQAVGECISLFHYHDIVHQDLNIENIQIDTDNKVYLLDFDKTQFSKSSSKLLNDNLDRLRRSISKLSISQNKIFPEKEWSVLVSSASN